jgi:DNA-binding GntR family transcriptional regulator
MESLDFSGREQLYYQLYNILFKSITDGVYREGECIPSENELVNRYHVSRMTARKSMEMLVSQGMVVKKKRDRYSCCFKSSKQFTTKTSKLFQKNDGRQIIYLQRGDFS